MSFTRPDKLSFLRFRSLRMTLLALVLLSLTLGSAGQELRVKRGEAPDQAGEDEILNRELWEFAKHTPYETALRHIAEQTPQAAAPSEAVLPNGWKIAPAGTQVELGRLPYEAVLYAGHLIVLCNGYYISEQPEVQAIDLSSMRVAKTLRYQSLFPSARAGLDGDLYISGGFSQKIYRVDRQLNQVSEYPVNGYTAGIAPVDAKHLAVAYMTTKDAAGDYVAGKISLLNTETGSVEREQDAGYFPYSVCYSGGKVYVGLLGENKLLVYSSGLDALKTVAVGRTPQDLCPDGDKLYAVNTGSDDISVVDLKKDTVAQTIKLTDKSGGFGRAPTSCDASADTLYVTLSGTNAVAAVDKKSGKIKGYIPAGWYPSRAILDDRQLMFLNAKGIRARRPNPKGPQPVKGKGGPEYVLTLLKGSLSVIPAAGIKDKLEAWTRQVEAGSPTSGNPSDLKPRIEHVFYIIRENRTYDQVLGDLGRGNGDPALTLFGRDVTPNAHRLAEEFVTLDNFSVDGEISVLGHSFTTSGYASPFLEWLGNTGYSGRYKGYPYGTVPAVFSPLYLWDALDEKNVSYRIYGEPYYLFTRAYRIIAESLGPDSDLARKFYAARMANAARTDRGKAFYQFAKGYGGGAETAKDAAELLKDSEFAHGLSKVLSGDDTLYQALTANQSLRGRFAEFLSRYAFNYSPWDLTCSDLLRAQAWKADFEKQVKSGAVAALHYIWLPNDHTAGSASGFMDPYQYVAQNDAALGRVVETISRSSVWSRSLILVEEDDGQEGPDHVDATRTVALAAGPSVKRGAVVSDRYDQLSLLRTIELLLGVNPINMNDRLAAPMFGIFSDKADERIYKPADPSAHLVPGDQALYLSLGQN